MKLSAQNQLKGRVTRMEEGVEAYAVVTTAGVTVAMDDESSIDGRNATGCMPPP
ncbi:hypothetical protein LJC20_01795 [Eubacteriales bacterium OttesenSCG-928-M02]|nr:hypothetical protein [Eubacteriales bacterium OttesenSCG-928-M02]